MNASKIAHYFTKLLIEDDDTDVIRFTFADDKRKIKCSKSMLSEISPVFAKMFSETWLNESIIKLEDNVTFDQYSTFKLFLELIYELRGVSSLPVYEATAVYHYSHKYQIDATTNKIQEHLNQRMKSGMSRNPFSVSELNDGLEFAETYQLEDFKQKLDNVKLDFNEENPVKFFDLAVKFEMDLLKQQVIDHLKNVEPNESWSLEISNLVIKSLQKEQRKQEHFLELLCENCKDVFSTQIQGTTRSTKKVKSLSL